MLTTLAYAVSKNRDAINELHSEARSIFEQKGIDATVYTNSAPVSTYNRVIIEGKDPKDKTDNWVRDIYRSSLEAVKEQDGREIYATKLEWEVPINFEFEDFRKQITGHPDIIIQSNTRAHQHKNRGNVPFSYDPAKDYYTEVDR